MMSVTMWQTTALDEQIAVRFFGWKWLAWTGRPTRSHPDYPTDAVRVRQLFSPEQLESEGWQEFLKSAEPAKGDEALSYAYCSSNGPSMVPHFSGDLDPCCQLAMQLSADLKSHFSLYFDSTDWTAGFVGQDGKLVASHEDENPCIAICRAALDVAEHLEEPEAS